MCANENTILYGYKIIRNCCIATMLCVTLMSCNDAEKPVFNDDVTTETGVNDVQTSAFESDTEDLSLPEFSISDEGVLTAHNGTSIIFQYLIMLVRFLKTHLVQVQWLAK